MTESTRPKAVVAWSSGKDSAYALHRARVAGELDIVGLLTTVTDAYDRVSMHGVRDEVLELQARAVGLPCSRVRIPAPCTNEQYEELMGAAIATLRADGVTHMVFGDLYLRDIREYRERQLRGSGIEPVFPLWIAGQGAGQGAGQRTTRELIHEMLRAGMRATISCLDPRVMPRAAAGRMLDASLLTELPDDVDPCGENGEFHTVVSDGPMFREPLDLRVGEVILRDGFVFADVLPAN